MHNASSYHSLPALLSGLHETLGAVAASRSGNASSPPPSFTLKSHPLPLTSEQSVQLDGVLTVRTDFHYNASLQLLTCAAAVTRHMIEETCSVLILNQSLWQVLAALFVLVPFCYLSGAFAINPVIEDASSAHHLQLLSGCPPAIYWAGSYVGLCVLACLPHATVIALLTM